MNSIPERTRRFHRDHPIADLLALNLGHPRFTVADIDLGKGTRPPAAATSPSSGTGA